MQLHYQIFFINLLFIWGVYVCFRPGMIWEKVDIIIRWKLYARIKPLTVDYWIKPFYKCPICMASVWGGSCFLLFVPLPLYYLPVYVFCMAGINYIIAQLISKEIEVSMK